MAYHEYIGNMHMHTPYSDGAASHLEIATAALNAQLDFVIVTDHNIWVDGVQGYYGDRDYVLLLTGEEVHDRTRQPQVNHCLVYGANREMTPYAANPQTLIDEVSKVGGLTFLAHPFDNSILWQHEEPGITWVDWAISGYTGLEVWNYMSSFKDVLETPWKTLRHAFDPDRAIIGPNPAMLAKWDELLASGQKVVGIGNSDAHGKRYRLGPISHTIFPYDFLFHCINTHILTPTPFKGEVLFDSAMIYQALRHGRAFISYQILGKARGFRFSGQGLSGTYAQMGESIRLQSGSGVTLQTVVPARAHIKLIRHGETVAEEFNVENLTYMALQSGAYRVEVWREYRGHERCWILSNPIYVEATPVVSE